MAFTRVQGQTGHNLTGSTATTPTTAFVSPTTAGNTIIVGTVNDGAPMTSVTDTGGNIYRRVAFKNHGNVYAEIWQAINIKATTSNVVTGNQGFNDGAIFAEEWVGQLWFDTWVGATMAPVTTNPNTGASPTTKTDNELVWVLGEIDVSGTTNLSVGAGYSNFATDRSNSIVGAIESQVVSTIGAQTGTMTEDNTAVSWAIVLATFTDQSPAVVSTFLPGRTWVRRFGKNERNVYAYPLVSATVVNTSISQVAATITFAGGSATTVSTTNIVSIAQAAATLTFTGGTQTVATVNNVAITQVAGTITFAGGTQSVATVRNVALSQVNATLTFAGGTQIVATSNFVSIAQAAGTITFSGGTQAIASIQKAAIAEVAATVTFTGGTQAVTTSNFVALSQSAATVTFAGGTQTLSGLVSTTIAQLAASLTFTGGSQAVAAGVSTNVAITQVAATLTFIGGVNAVTVKRTVDTWVSPMLTVYGGSKFSTVSSGAKIDNVVSGATINTVTTGNKNETISSGENSTTVTSGNEKGNL